MSVDLIVGRYNATAQAHLLIRAAWHLAGQPDSRECGYMDALDDQVEVLLEQAGDSARGDHSRGELLAFAQYEALKAEVLRIRAEEVQP